MKVAINVCYGGFSLSPVAVQKLYEDGVKEVACPIDEYFGKNYKDRKIEALDKWRKYLTNNNDSSMFLTVFSPDEKYVLSTHCDLERNDPRLIKVIEELGEKANGSCAKIRMVEIPDGVDYEIAEYDGMEHIAETHRTWS